MSDTFKALRALEVDGAVSIGVEDLSNADLPEGDVTIRVKYSTVNYKDGLALKGNQGKIMRRFPMVPGIDFAGVVEESEVSHLLPGEEVILTGWGLGESHPGGFTQKARVRSEWVIKKPDALTLQQTMAIGTAGLTAMLCVMTLEEEGVSPEKGEVLVTGAAGGVGSVGVAILGELGYQVAASTGRPETNEYLKALGAGNIIPRADLAQPARPMAAERWAGCLDTVAGQILASVLPSVQTGGCVAACGNAAGINVPMTILPFILRGVSLRGVDSNTCPIDRRQIAWDRLAKTLPRSKLDAMTVVRPLTDVMQVADEILSGQVRGRTVIDVNQL